MLTVGGQFFFAKSAGFVIGSQAIVSGGAPVTIDSMVVSLGASGKLVIGSEMTTLPSGGSEVEETIGGVVIDAPIATGSSLGGTALQIPSLLHSPPLMKPTFQFIPGSSLRSKDSLLH